MFFFFQAEDGIRDYDVTGVQTCALPILPPFIALNEPEASLHPDLMKPLAGLIAKAAERSQVWLVTHSERLAQALAGEGAVRTVHKVAGATQIKGLTPA